MRLLLTSVGVTNNSIRKALVELLGKPVEECQAVQITTVLYASPSGPEDAYQMARYYGEMGWKELGSLELTTLPTIEEEHWLPFVESSDAILVSGGNTGYLSYWLQESGFAERLPGLLEERVYFGISAGSAMATLASTTTHIAWSGRASTKMTSMRRPRHRTRASRGGWAWWASPFVRT